MMMMMMIMMMMIAMMVALDGVSEKSVHMCTYVIGQDD